MLRLGLRGRPLGYERPLGDQAVLLLHHVRFQQLASRLVDLSATTVSYASVDRVNNGTTSNQNSLSFVLQPMKTISNTVVPTYTLPANGLLLLA